jgi:hypothetical protein
MSLKTGIEVKNGGRTVTVGGYVMDNITSYDVTVKKIYDESFSFTAADGKDFKVFKGTKTSVKLKTGRLSPEKYAALKVVLDTGSAVVSCGDLDGECNISDVSVKLDKDDFYGTFYYVDFTAEQAGVTVPDSL